MQFSPFLNNKSNSKPGLYEFLYKLYYLPQNVLLSLYYILYIEF